MTTRHINTLHGGLTYGVHTTFTNTTNTYTALRAEAIVSTPGINMIPVAYQKSQNMRGPDADVVGGKSGTLAFNTPIRAGAGSGSPFIALAQYCGATKYAHHRWHVNHVHDDQRERRGPRVHVNHHRGGRVPLPDHWHEVHPVHHAHPVNGQLDDHGQPGVRHHADHGRQPAGH